MRTYVVCFGNEIPHAFTGASASDLLIGEPLHYRDADDWTARKGVLKHRVFGFAGVRSESVMSVFQSIIGVIADLGFKEQLEDKEPNLLLVVDSGWIEGRSVDVPGELVDNVFQSRAWRRYASMNRVVVALYTADATLVGVDRDAAELQRVHREGFDLVLDAARYSDSSAADVGAMISLDTARVWAFSNRTLIP